MTFATVPLDKFQIKKPENKFGFFDSPGLGFEPKYPASKAGVLPLDDPGILENFWIKYSINWLEAQDILLDKDR